MPKRSAGMFAYDDEDMAALRLAMAPSVLMGNRFAQGTRRSLQCVPDRLYLIGVFARRLP